MIIGWFMLISSFGLAEGLSKYIPEFRAKNENDKIKYLFRKSSYILLVCSIFSGILLFFLSNYIAISLFHEPALIKFLKIFSILIPANVFLTFFWAILKSYEKIGLSSLLSNVVSPLIQLLAILTLIYFGFDVNAIIFSYFIGIMATIVITLIVSKRELPLLFKKRDSKERYGGLF